MTVSTSFSVSDSACNGSTTAFPVAFQFANPSDLIVELIDNTTQVVTLLVEGTDYTRSGDGMAAPSGILTATAYPAGKTIRRRRETPRTQVLDMVPNVGAPAESQERAWDRSILISQELAEQIGRSLRLPIGSNAPIVPAMPVGEDRTFAWVNGEFRWIATDTASLTGAVETAVAAAAAAAGFAADTEDDRVQTALDADRAELAAAAAALSAGIYINEATGRAAVANGVVFSAVGATSDKAVDIWQRVNSGSSTLLRSYPSLAALNAAIAAFNAAIAASASMVTLLAVKSTLETGIQETAVSLTSSRAHDLAVDRMLEPATFIDNIMGVNAVGRGTRPRNPIATFAYIYTPAPVADTTVLFRAGQQHMIIPNSDGNSLYIGGTTKRTNIASYGVEGNYGACLDTRMPLSGQTWTASGDGWSTTVTLRNSLNFSGAANIAGVHLMLWHVPAPHDDVLGDYCELHIGNANPAANDTAVDGTSGVTAWSIKYAGQTAGDIRGTGHVGDTYTLHIKMADGSNPNDKPLFLADYVSGVNLTTGSHGHVMIIGTTGKDSANFQPAGNASLGLIPWFESLTMVGVGGHGGVGPKCTVGAFTAVGVPIPGEATYASGQTGGGGCHNFSAGFDLSNQYLYNGSIYASNFAIAGCYAHGGGGGSESYRGWNVGGDIVQNNCTTGIEIEITLVEGFKHAGRLILIDGQQGVNSYPGQYFQLAGRGGLFKPIDSQAVVATFTGGGARSIVIGSDDPEEVMVLDAGQVNGGSPGFHSAQLYARRGTDSDPPPSLILKHVEDRTVIGTGVRKFSIGDVGFDPNLPYVGLTLIGSKLGDMWPSFDYSPHYPTSLYVDGDSEIGFHGRTWAQIETAMAGLGNPCTILTGARAVDASGNIVDTK